MKKKQDAKVQMQRELNYVKREYMGKKEIVNFDGLIIIFIFIYITKYL